MFLLSISWPYMHTKSRVCVFKYKRETASHSESVTFFISAALWLGQQWSHLLQSNSLIRVKRGKGIRLIRGDLSVASSRFSLAPARSKESSSGMQPHIKCSGHFLWGIFGFWLDKPFSASAPLSCCFFMVNMTEIR